MPPLVFCSQFLISVYSRVGENIFNCSGFMSYHEYRKQLNTFGSFFSSKDILERNTGRNKILFSQEDLNAALEWSHAYYYVATPISVGKILPDIVSLVVKAEHSMHYIPCTVNILS